jgi:hypothetical protein
MGDDTHMSAKILQGTGDKTASQEIGFQDPWFDPAVAVVLKKDKQSLINTINEYRARLMG